MDIADGCAGPCTSWVLGATSAARCVISLPSSSSLLSPPSFLPSPICLSCPFALLPQYPVATSYMAPGVPHPPSSSLAHVCLCSLMSALTCHIHPRSLCSTLARCRPPSLSHPYTPPASPCPRARCPALMHTTLPSHAPPSMCCHPCAIICTCLHALAPLHLVRTLLAHPSMLTYRMCPVSDPSPLLICALIHSYMHIHVRYPLRVL
ncbi:hypothetical protein EVG20_g10526 [Dentipellis fragilis]|uniref:Uncharacterized protein n=1 Tax=Dentipellis fragilis TaxID=205917 RepID=A0A4Y9XQY1_9AGAM|nr:hypothetical protein EVG20_g10526 [Dentipellis fragilis]